MKCWLLVWTVAYGFEFICHWLNLPSHLFFLNCQFKEEWIFLFSFVNILPIVWYTMDINTGHEPYQILFTYLCEEVSSPPPPPPPSHDFSIHWMCWYKQIKTKAWTVCIFDTCSFIVCWIALVTKKNLTQTKVLFIFQQCLQFAQGHAKQMKWRNYSIRWQIKKKQTNYYFLFISF